MPKFVSIPEAGRRLGRSPRTVKRLIARGQLQAISIPGTHARVSLEEVEAYVPARLRAGRSDLRAGAAGRADLRLKVIDGALPRAQLLRPFQGLFDRQGATLIPGLRTRPVGAEHVSTGQRPVQELPVRQRPPGVPRPLPGHSDQLWTQYRQPRVEPEPEVEPELPAHLDPRWVSFGGGDPSGLWIQIPEPTR